MIYLIGEKLSRHKVAGASSAEAIFRPLSVAGSSRREIYGNAGAADKQHPIDVTRFLVVVLVVHTKSRSFNLGSNRAALERCFCQDFHRLAHNLLLLSFPVKLIKFLLLTSRQKNFFALPPPHPPHPGSYEMFVLVCNHIGARGASDKLAKPNNNGKANALIVF